MRATLGQGPLRSQDTPTPPTEAGRPRLSKEICVRGAVPGDARQASCGVPGVGERPRRSLLRDPLPGGVVGVGRGLPAGVGAAQEPAQGVVGVGDLRGARRLGDQAAPGVVAPGERPAPGRDPLDELAVGVVAVEVPDGAGRDPAEIVEGCLDLPEGGPGVTTAACPCNLAGPGKAHGAPRGVQLDPDARLGRPELRVPGRDPAGVEEAPPAPAAGPGDAHQLPAAVPEQA